MRVEISTALKREIRVIPVLVEGATMPEAADLPDELKALIRRNALKLSHDRFRTESEQLASTVERVLENTEARRRELQESERLDTKRREIEQKERRESERRQKEEQDRLGTEQHQREETKRISESRGREQRERQKSGFDRPEEKQAEAQRGKGEQQEVAPPTSKFSFAQKKASHPPAEEPKFATSWSQVKKKWLLAVALAMISATGIIWFAAQRERTKAPVGPMPTPTPESTPTPSTPSTDASIDVTVPGVSIPAHPKHVLRTSVVNINRNDTLPLRSGPGLRFHIVKGLPADATDILAFDRDQLMDSGIWWCPIEWQGVRGYVDSSYLRP